MNYETALNHNAKLMDWIAPYTESATTAGSIRRDCQICNDVDIVCIPKVAEVRDLFGAVTSTTNLLHKFLKEYVQASGGKAKFQSGGEAPGKSVILQLPKCQLDLWFATPETFATRLLCRTGSMQHNIWLATRAKRRDEKWNPYEGILHGGQWRKVGDAEVYEGGTLTRYNSEAEIYAALDLPFIEPKNREPEWIIRNFGE